MLLVQHMGAVLLRQTVGANLSRSGRRPGHSAIGSLPARLPACPTVVYF